MYCTVSLSLEHTVDALCFRNQMDWIVVIIKMMLFLDSLGGIFTPRKLCINLQVSLNYTLENAFQSLLTALC